MERETARIAVEMAKADELRNAAAARHEKAKADVDTAANAGDGVAVVEATGRRHAEAVIVDAQSKRLAELGRQHTEALKRETEADDDRYFADLDKRIERQAKTLPADYAKASAPLAAMLSKLASDADECAEANKRRCARGLPPILTAEERVRVIPGYVKPARYEDKNVWRKREGGQEVSVFKKNAVGDWVPEEGGCVRSVEKVCVGREEHVPARHAASFLRAVALPGFMPGDEPVWPPKGARS